MNRISVKFLLIIILALLGVACQEDRVESPAHNANAADEQGHVAENGQGEEHQHDKDEEAGQGDHDEGRVRLSPEALSGEAFQTALVERRSLKDEIQVTANIKPNAYSLSHISPRIEGKAIKVMAELGDRVKPGQTLALLDSIELGQQKAAYLQARVNLNVARRNYEREQRLFNQRISSEKEYLEAKGEFERSQASYRAAYEALRLVGLPDEKIKGITWSVKGQPLSYFPLAAPHAGTVIERHLTRGELVTPEDKPFTVADLTTVWILLDIYEKDLARVSVGAEVRIMVDAYPGETFTGRVAYFSNLLNPDTRTVEARVEVGNPKQRLRPGMFARAALAIPSSEGQEVLVVPQEAIQQVKAEPVTFVEERPGTYAVRHLTLGTKVDRDVEVRSGLTEGERVVTNGSFYLKSILLAEEMGGHAH